MPIKILIVKGTNWMAALECQEDGDDIRPEKAVVSDQGGERLAFVLTPGFTFPKDLLTQDVGVWRFRSLNEYRGDKNLRADLLKRLGTIEVHVSPDVQHQFLGISLDARTSAHIRIVIDRPDPTNPSAPNDPLKASSVEFSALFDLDVTVKGKPIKRTLAFTSVFNPEKLATVRLDLHDFNISLPAFKLPDLDLTQPRLLELVDDTLSDGIASVLATFADTKVTFTTGGGVKPMLALHQRDASFDCAVVRPDFTPADWNDAALGGKLVQFKATVASGGATFAEIDDLHLVVRANTPLLAGKVTLHTGVAIHDGATRLGPFAIQWDGVRLSPAATIDDDEGGSEASLRVEVAFDRLLFRVHDDPEAALAFRGAVEVTPSGVRLLRLALVAPCTLSPTALDALARAATPVVRLALDFAGAGADKLASLLGTLARMAAALGRTAVTLLGTGLDTAGDLLSRSTAGVAEVLGDAIARLADLARGTDALAVELRIGTSPLCLHQVLVSLRGGTDDKLRTIDAAGMVLDLTSGWRPGLLLDFTHQLGAYITLTGTGTLIADTPIAGISTDFWLRSKTDAGTRSAVLRDADAKSGDRATPLLAVRLKLKQAPTKPIVVLLAGLQGGRAVFLQQLIADTFMPVPGVMNLTTPVGPITFKAITAADFALDVKFEKDRVLPLLGLGELGRGPDFLTDLLGGSSNVVSVKDTRTTAELEKLSIAFDLTLALSLPALSTEVVLRLKLSLATFEVEFEADQKFPIKSRRIEKRALGLVWIVEQKAEKERCSDAEIAMFSLVFAGGQTALSLNEDLARMELRVDGLGADGRGLSFLVSTFKLGPGGLDLVADVLPAPVRLGGLDVPFTFTTGAIEFRGNKLVSAAVTGRGALPRALVGEADCTAAFMFGEDPIRGIVLQSAKVELDKRGDPIVCESTRFTLKVSELELAFVADDGYHFFFLVTGDLRFTPRIGELDSGLLQCLDGIEINLEKTPLSSDPRVLLRHINFQKVLSPKKSFNLFHLFTFELRGFGYHPSAAKFGGDPAINLSGQIKFVEIGDVMQPQIDFHGLWIAPPKKGQILPRIKADGLALELDLKGAIKVKGEVIAVDPETPSVEGVELAPKGYNAAGFLGRGEFEIPGWGNLAANLGFLEIESKDRPGERHKSFFFYAEQRQIAVVIPTPIWEFYLREVGLGLGFRYTLAALQAADEATSVPKLVKALDEVSKTQGDLHKFSTWKPEPDGDRVTLALKGVIQAYPANTPWNPKKELEAQNPFLFDLVAALRSDFTLFMGVRGWLATNYIDYLEDKDGLRANPGLRGYLYISAPQKRLLARMIGDPKGYIGERLPALKSGADGSEPPLRRALRSVAWSATLFIKPGLFHYELGWPDQLAVTLIEKPNITVRARGGMIFRAAEDGLLWGYNIEADGTFRFGGAVERSFGRIKVGLSAAAVLQTHVVARLLAYLSFRFRDSLVYGLFTLDATLAVSVNAFLEVSLFKKTKRWDASFSFTLQFSAAVEIALTPGGVGARADLRVGVSAFGRTLSVGVGFTLDQGRLDAARAQVQRFLALSITNEQPDVSPLSAAATADQRIEADAEYAEAPHEAPHDPTKDPDLQERTHHNAADLPLFVAKPTDFWLVLRVAARPPLATATATPVALVPDPVYALLVPKESARADIGGFYAAATCFDHDLRDERVPAHVLSLPADKTANLSHVLRHAAGITPQLGSFAPFTLDQGAVRCTARWNAPLADESDALTLAHLFDECFLSDTRFEGEFRDTFAWCDPPPHIHAAPSDPAAGTDAERSAERDLKQRQHGTDARKNPIIDAVHQARSSALGTLLEQFVELAETGARSEKLAHVTDLGLVFFGPAAEIESLATLEVRKFQPPRTPPRPDYDAAKPGKIEVLNPREWWFDRQDPLLAASRSAVTSEGVKLDWRLTLPFAAPIDDLEQLLHHYEIVRTVEGREFRPRTLRVKPAATIGGKDPHSSDGAVELIRPDWQFVDDLADLAADVRRVLLPSSDTPTLKIAIDWQKEFGDQTAITVTYSVTPIDIAGARGLPKSFLVEIPRPVTPIRPAEAELRFVVTRLSTTRKAHAAATFVPDSLAIVMALNDPLPPPEAGDYRFRRFYHLIADPDDIRPSGHYGSDGLTERKLVPASAVAQPADASVWCLDAASFQPITDDESLDRALARLEPDDLARSQFSAWRRLAGETRIADLDARLKLRPATLHTPGDQHADHPITALTADPRGSLLDVLWRRHGAAGGPRVATRFALQTVDQLEYKGKLVGAPIVSATVPVGLELRVTTREKPDEPSVSRPEAFEWPVHLEFPPHGAGQLVADTGFARFRMPRGDLAALLSGSSNALSLVRDPERRILTRVRFDAVLSSTTPDPVHATAIAGYDLHELDIDDLARGDTSTVPFAANPEIWRRARRVARIERVSPETARLMPDANNDWMGWHAHYPSEEWRLRTRDLREPGQTPPPRARWYSAADSTIYFAERTPRVRLLSTVPEQEVTNLLADGRATRLAFALTLPPNDRRDPTIDKQIARIPLHLGDKPARYGVRIDLADPTRRRTAVVMLSPTQVRKLSPTQIRAALLYLEWRPNEPIEGRHDEPIEGRHDEPIVAAFKRDPALFDGLALTVQGLAGPDDAPRLTGIATIPLTFATFLHPLLDEVCCELEYHADIELLDEVCRELEYHADIETHRLYRRYVVTRQVVQPSEDRDLAGFLATTAADKDPYGWRALQELGLATTLKIFDRDTDRFLDATQLLTRIRALLNEARKRHDDAFAPREPTTPLLSRPIVEVLLKPGRDRVPGPFDAVLRGGVEDDPGSLDLTDDALSLVQLSLRPQPLPGRSYAHLAVTWEPSDPASPSTPRALPARLRGYDLLFARLPDLAYDLLDLTSGRITRVLPLPGEPVRVPVAGPPDPVRVPVARPPDPRFLLRCPVGLVLPEKFVTAEARVEIFKAHAVGDPERWHAQTCSLDALHTDYHLVGPSSATPTITWIADPGAHPELPSPFDRFGALLSAEWTALTTMTLPASLEPGTPTAATTENLRRGLESLRQNLRATIPALVWLRTPGVANYHDFAAVMPAYLPWCQRFLDHNLAPDRTAQAFALAAPIKSLPWHLAADRDGRLSLSFLHADRWAHTRAYAVRATGRYTNLAIAAGHYGDRPQDSESLVTVAEAAEPLRPIGYALAVSPRTERIEPPVILGTRLTGTGDDKQWELVVARHGEQALAASNRSLFARLGTEGTALSFLREYRTPNWPATLSLASAGSSWPIPELYPTSDPVAPTTPALASAIDGPALATLSLAHPSLWKGADIWRIGDLLPHYRVTALAVARAGLVVSPVVTAVQDATPRRTLRAGDPTVLLGEPALVIAHDDDKTAYTLVDLRLVAHHDLAPHRDPATTHARVPATNDIDWWPDPAVTYTLFRHAKLADGATLEDEDATVGLLADGPYPFVVRARGPRLEPADLTDHPDTAGRPLARTTVVHARRDFFLEFTLHPHPKAPPIAAQTARFVGSKDDLGDLRTKRAAFRAAAIDFAKLVPEYALTLSGFTGAPVTLAAAMLWLKDQATAAEALATAIAATGHPAAARVATAVGTIAAGLRGEADDLITPPGQADPPTPAPAILERPRSHPIDPGPEDPPNDLPTALLKVEATHVAEVLTLTRLPDVRDATAVAASGHPFAARADPAVAGAALLWRLCKHALLGTASGLRVRAVDTRNAIDIASASPTAPGEVTVDVKLPEWTTWA